MNVLYPTTKERLLAAQFSWLTASVSVGLYGSATVYDAAHTVVGDLAGTQIAVVSNLTARNNLNGYAMSSPAVFSALTSATPVAVAILYEPTGELVAFIDDATGFPYTPLGDDFQLIPAGAGGAWFQL